MIDDDLTVMASGATSGAGWLSTSGSIDHGRFSPGAVIDGRYRIIGLLGRGGMGEVYRADDLRLGQPVAIKLLPETLAGDPQRLVQFHNEVRTARQVSHPNVCRVYDIGDLVIEGSQASHHQLYLTMEYVDGEDLSSLLRRIGRLPEDKALDIARQICAGLAAAHARGVIHRDLKPANIMLDSSGQARLMDFGLAAAGAVTNVREGTPAYMAPEQLSGTGVTVQSDVFALGLVLYELFTGRRGFQAKTLGELVDLQQSGTIVPPSALVTGLNPAIERIILRCLRSTPAERPASATAVAAALPGGDPLAAALAAGETPSPQMVAAAGDEAASITPARASLWLVVALAGLVATALLSNRLSLYATVGFDRAPATLVDRARDIERLAGVDRPTQDRASGLIRASAPHDLVFWYRSSDRWLLPREARVSPSDPAPAPGDTLVVLSLDGRLLWYEGPATTTLDTTSLLSASPLSTPPPVGATSAIGQVALLIVPALLIAAAFVARANVRAGRGDRLGARRLAGTALLLLVAAWIFQAHHVPDVGLEQERLFAAIGRALFDGATLWIFYLAAEPYVRRTWPHILITWSRLLGGTFRDGLVGRDLLVGAACGVAMTVISYGFHLVPGLFGWDRFPAHGPDLILGTRALLGKAFTVGSNALTNAMLGVLGLALLRAGLQRAWAPLGGSGVAFGVATLLFTPLAARGQFQSGHAGLDLLFGLLLVLIILGVLFRFGLFAGIVGFFCHFWTWGVVATLNADLPFFETGLVGLVVVGAIAIGGFVLAQPRRS